MDINISKLRSLLNPCLLCPNQCQVNRSGGETGICKLGDKLMVSAVNLHFGEEPELVGSNGSGTIFFTGCNMKCIFCQNHDISREMNGHFITEGQLADYMLKLQDAGALNINLVTPTPLVPMIFSAVEIAKNYGLCIPIVYNTGGYDSIEVLKFIEGMVDIYMPDMKYGSNENGLKYSGVKSYFDISKEAVKEMHRQVGDLVTNKKGVAVKGLLIRHLILPNDLAGSKNVLEFIANEISKETYVNIMEQYWPAYRAHEHKELMKSNISQEYAEAIEFASNLGLHRGF